MILVHDSLVHNSDGYDFVMPAKAGIQKHKALACSSAFWIPGLALLARNDATTTTAQMD